MHADSATTGRHDDGLTSMTIPAGVTSIGSGAFAGCAGLTRISISTKNSAYRSFNDVLIDKAGKTLVCYPAGKAGAYSVPYGITTIGKYAFGGSKRLTSMEIPESVTTIEDSAFYDCTSLTDVVIPDGITSIGGYAFYRCTGLKSVKIPDSVTSIGDNAFYGCTSLTNVSIPAGATLGKEAFPGNNRAEGARPARGASSHIVEVTRRPGETASSQRVRQTREETPQSGRARADAQRAIRDKAQATETETAAPRQLRSRPR